MPTRVEHARGGGVDVGHHRGCTQPASISILARVRARAASAPAFAAAGHLARFSTSGSRLRTPGRASSRCRTAAARQAVPSARRAVAVSLAPRGTFSSTMWRPMSTRWPYSHARRAGGFAVAAGQAAVEVQLRLARRRRAFEHLLDQVDAAARAVEFVAEELVGRAGGGAEAAMHALAQDALRRRRRRACCWRFGEGGLHVRNPGTGARG